MKNPIYILLIIFLMSSCSVLGILGGGISSDQEGYVKKVIQCDAGVDSFVVHNMDEWVDFFNGNDEQLNVIYQKIEDDILDDENKSVTIYRTNPSNHYYYADFDAMTLPFTDCRKLKNEAVRL